LSDRTKLPYTKSEHIPKDHILMAKKSIFNYFLTLTNNID